VDINIYLAQQRVRMKVASTRAEAALARLGAARPSSSLSDELTRGLTASQIERDAKSLRNILGVWKATGKGGPGSTIQLPSGRTFRMPADDNGAPKIQRLERAVTRPWKYTRR
jgi:hypothetical protein